LTKRFFLVEPATHRNGVVGVSKSFMGRIISATKGKGRFSGHFLVSTRLGEN